jgi:hypothetical protein
MDIYYSNAQSEKWDDIKIKPFPMLAAYYALPKSFERSKKASLLMLDSGAFSAFRQKIVISVEEYIKFIKRTKIKFDYMVALDVFGKDELSYTNYMKMYDSGINCIPVFHIGADPKYLKRYIKKTNYVGIGGIALLSTANRRPFVDSVFREYPDPKEIGFHGFGVNDINMIRSYPWKSVDARSAHIAARFGSINTPWGLIRMNPNMPSTGPSTILWQTDPIKKKKIEKYLEDIGVDVEKTMLQNTTGKVERCKASIIYFEKYIKPQCPTYFKSQINYFL